MAEDSFNLFYPWFYQGEMSGEIYNYKGDIQNRPDIDGLKYNKNELIRLYRDFNDIDLTGKTFLLHIGANCNNYIGNAEFENCKRRLIPQFFLNSGLPSVIFIVDNFGDNSDISVLSTPELTIEKEGENKYIAAYGENEDITIYVYNTYFPTYLDEKIYYTFDEETTQFIIEKKAESDDKRFVKLFYERLQSFLLKPYYSVILSTASFANKNVTAKKLKNNIIEGYGNINFELYPEIMENMVNPKIIFITWVFGTEYFFMLKQGVKFNYKLSAIDIRTDEDKLMIYGSKEFISDIKLGKDNADYIIFNYFRDNKNNPITYI